MGDNKVQELDWQRREAGRNDEDRVEWFRDVGFGLFIHYGINTQLGAAMSWPLSGSDERFTEQYFDLADTFDPDAIDFDQWATLARQAGMGYVTFTTKHHDGFCLFESSHTDFDVTNTPYGRDIVSQVARAFREKGLGVGWYYSPPDLRYQHETGKDNTVRGPDYEAAFEEWTEAYGPLAESFEEFERGHIEELLTRYGDVDLLFFDGFCEPLKEKAWAVDDDVIVTRGEMDTPELTMDGIPEDPPDPPWEACLPIQHNAWANKPVFENDASHNYKSTNQILDALIEVRAKGGNLLFNIGPTANGALPEEATKRLRNLGYWNAVNGEAIHAVRPWVRTHEETAHGTVWYTRKKNADTVYAFCRMSWGEKQDGDSRVPADAMPPVDISLEGVRTNEDTQIRLLGKPEPLEYEARAGGVDVTVDPDGQALFEWYWRCDDWPVVLKITDATEPTPEE